MICIKRTRSFLYIRCVQNKLMLLFLTLFASSLLYIFSSDDGSKELPMEMFYSLLAQKMKEPIELAKYCNEETCFRVVDTVAFPWDGPLVVRSISIDSAPGAAHTVSELYPRDFTLSSLNTAQWNINKTSVRLGAYHYVQCGVFAWNKVLNASDDGDLLVIGVGGGQDVNFFEGRYPKLRIVGVELEAVMPRIGREWFGLAEEQRVRIEIGDGAEYIKREAEKGTHFDAIVLDATYSNLDRDIVSPVEPFHADDVIAAIAKLIGDTGMLSINTVIGTGKPISVLDKFLSTLRSHFSHVEMIKINDFNRVTVCSQLAITFVDPEMPGVIAELMKLQDPVADLETIG